MSRARARLDRIEAKHRPTVRGGIEVWRESRTEPGRFTCDNYPDRTLTRDEVSEHAHSGNRTIICVQFVDTPPQGAHVAIPHNGRDLP